jgi:hypothetical protein
VQDISTPSLLEIVRGFQRFNDWELAEREEGGAWPRWSYNLIKLDNDPTRDILNTVKFLC